MRANYGSAYVSTGPLLPLASPSYPGKLSYLPWQEGTACAIIGLKNHSITKACDIDTDSCEEPVVPLRLHFKE